MKSLPSKRKKAIDWQQVRQRLAQAQAATEAALRISPERAREVMEQRARILARPATAGPGDSGGSAPAPGDAVLEVATFNLANERYAIETQHLREVVRLTDFTPVPGAPDFLVGVINLRGQILALIDLRKILGVREKGLTDLSRVLVLGSERAEFGIQADAVHEVRNLRASEVLESPSSTSGQAREYLRGVTKEALIVLDGGVLLQDRRLFIDHDEEPGPRFPGEPT